MEGDPAVVLSNLRKRRGTVRGTIAKLGNRLPELEAVDTHLDTADRAIAKLENLATELKSIHFQVINLIDAADEGTLEREQEYHNKLDDDVTSFLLRLQRLAINRSDPPAVTTSCRAMMA